MINGEKIRDLRQGMDKSLAEMAFYVGVSESMLRQIELGYKNPSVEGLKRMAEYLGVTTDALHVAA
ncbi:MAG: helix-turn-helix domain-containing protein [Defluviitaleaceae bacterium]|nr:helix-turn-helix domain-containing protein [Defluviitaleaceae bacterium]